MMLSMALRKLAERTIAKNVTKILVRSTKCFEIRISANKEFNTLFIITVFIYIADLPISWRCFIVSMVYREFCHSCCTADSANMKTGEIDLEYIRARRLWTTQMMRHVSIHPRMSGPYKALPLVHRQHSQEQYWHSSSQTVKRWSAMPAVRWLQPKKAIAQQNWNVLRWDIRWQHVSRCVPLYHNHGSSIIEVAASARIADQPLRTMGIRIAAIFVRHEILKGCAQQSRQCPVPAIDCGSGHPSRIVSLYPTTSRTWATYLTGLSQTKWHTLPPLPSWPLILRYRPTNNGRSACLSESASASCTVSTLSPSRVT